MRKPDWWVNAYPAGIGAPLGTREEANCFARQNRIGIWRVYLK